MRLDRPVLVLSHDAARCATWQRALSAAGLNWIPWTELETNHVDVVLTDNPQLRQELRLPTIRWERGEIGMVLVGGSGPADVLLPRDATPREIVLACRMLGQIVSLRRRLGQEEKQQRILRAAAATDSLTGLANRRAWDEMLHRLAHPTSAPVSPGVKVLALLDIDGFKRWNDEFGHSLADQQLISVAERLTTAVRPGDFVFRWGGDEFVVLLQGLAENQAATAVERIRQAAGLNAPRSLTLSAGWAVLCSSDNQTVAFREADERLRSAKTAGGNQTSPTSP